MEAAIKGYSLVTDIPGDNKIPEDHLSIKKTWQTVGTTNAEGIALIEDQPARMEYIVKIGEEAYQSISDTIYLVADTTLEYTLQYALNSVSIEEGTITVYPNPAKDYFYISALQPVHNAYLINMLGQQMLVAEPYEISNNRYVDISQLVKGA